MEKFETNDYLQTLIYDSEHATATIDEAYEKVCAILKNID